MTDARLAKARRLAEDHDFTHVEFRKGSIEEPPVDPGGCDRIPSNGVINRSPDRPAVFAAAASALRAGGRVPPRVRARDHATRKYGVTSISLLARRR